MRPIDADALIENWQEDAEHMETEIFKLATYAAINDVQHAPTVEPERKKDKWIPFTYRTPTEEEKEDHPDWDYVLDCKLPEDGQRILVNIKCKAHETVQLDEFYYDSEECYLDSGYDIGTEATAWMPLPAPYRDEE